MKPRKNVAESVRARLLAHANETGEAFHMVLAGYAIGRSIAWDDHPPSSFSKEPFCFV